LLHDFVLHTTECLLAVLHDLLYTSDCLEFVTEIRNLNFVEMAEKSNDARSDIRQLYKMYTSKLDILKLTDNTEKHGGIACMLGYHILQ
jgi:hypothetical protein